ncbi:hypothetical protein ONZ45_g5687 [Pleurotus djamor]|nr:hypothetical protein ONZ45_g5687 [Pleurotus djamor]
MPAKYSHVKKRSANGLLAKKHPQSGQAHPVKLSAPFPRSLPLPSPHTDRGVSQSMSAVAELERAIARILLLRFEQDIARLYSTRLYSVSLLHLPTLVMRCVALGGPGWAAYNADADEVKDFFRSAISMDLRQAGERVATKSVLWSYTALRHFAMSNDIPICQTKGLHSLRLLPFFPALKSYLDVLESMPVATFTKPPHLGPLVEGFEALEEACEIKYANPKTSLPPEWSASEWRNKVRVGYEKMSQTLWRVSKEFDVRGYGLVLRDKLTTKWCDCGCSTDHLGEVCERTVREEEDQQKVDNGIKPGNGKCKGMVPIAAKGKEREWDGRGSGVFGWETEEEEDIWELELDFCTWDENAGASNQDNHRTWKTEDDLGMTIGEAMEWRYVRAERAKEEGNIAYRKEDYPEAVKHYEAAYHIEPELPHYQLNLAAAHLKLNDWMAAEKACTLALGQHRSSKGYYRRAKARKMQGKVDEAIKGKLNMNRSCGLLLTVYLDLRAALKLQPNNNEANGELAALSPSPAEAPSGPSILVNTANSAGSSSTSSSIQQNPRPASSPERQGHASKAKAPKPPPFPKCLADERKIKLVPLPTTIEKGRAHHDLYCTKHASQFQMTGEPVNETATLSSPSWDRYIAKRIN